jgi:hypothetical protein
MAKQSRYKHFWVRLFITLILLSLIAFCVGLVLWGSNSSNIDIALCILAGISAFVAFGQWLFPWSSREPEPPLSSNVTLIDAALDPHDSPYEQSIENGRTKISYKDQKPKRVTRDK